MVQNMVLLSNHAWVSKMFEMKGLQHAGTRAPIEHFSNFFYSICGATLQMNQEVGSFLVLLDVSQCSIRSTASWCFASNGERVVQTVARSRFFFM